ncbi:protein of unknown function [Nocardioides terrae]|uniref:DUF1707 domain-containing protein n=1 Tax=Nocardioides terrae TaxID=574651 RepID=A0A1I1NAQ7_9ACTN|nr:DUF1707 domain-containing protein [Nocardioides terrae]SFC92558.1 protein of unknown function [Nocardioides terrae]
MTGEIRIGDAERERAAEILGDHYAAGRLDHEEYAERLDAIWSARTRGDLDVLFHDLPRPVVEEPVARAPHGPRRPGLPVPLIVLAVVLAAFVVTHIPFILFALVVVLVVKGGRQRRWATGRHGQRSGFPGRW